MENTSLLGKVWHLRTGIEREALSLSQKLGLSPITSKILALRGVDASADALKFLSPKLTDLPDPLHLLDMEKAVNFLSDKIQNKTGSKINDKKIAIFGDYDVDGGCATALLVRFFRTIGVEVALYIPDRMTEGYGPNAQAMDDIKAMNADTVITVDCGSVAFEPMAHAKSIGLNVIITDHHQTLPTKPECVALINPNRIDETSNCTMLSGAGVAFYLALALTRALRADGYFEKNNIKEPDNRYLLDLVAVSTVCDMVPLTGPNRVLVGMGLKALGMRRNLGLAALADVAGVEERPGTYHAGFVIGPRINAGGRISDCDLGAKLLSTENLEEATKLAGRLHLLNEERKRIEETVIDSAMAMAEKAMESEPSALVIAGDGWHEGVIGIVASRVKEKFHRPTFILAINGDEAKGSGRSISGIDLGKAVIDLKDLLIKGGGHKMAAGLSIETGKIDAFRDALCAHVAAQVTTADKDIFIPSLSIDDFLTVEGASVDLLAELEKLEPYGVGHAEPRFAINDAYVAFAKSVGADGTHVTFGLKGTSGQTLRGIAFRAMENGIGPALLKAAKDKGRLTVCGQLRKNEWQGRTSAQFMLQDARLEPLV